jgi:hypothetical protein
MQRCSRLAATNQLRAHIPEQIQRMLKDPKSERFVKNFVGQWLQNRDTQTVSIQPWLSWGSAKERKGKSSSARSCVKRCAKETDLLFQHLLRENLPAEILSGNSFENQTSASFYGVPGVKGQPLRKVDLPKETHRQGILSHGSFLWSPFN